MIQPGDYIYKLHGAGALRLRVVEVTEAQVVFEYSGMKGAVAAGLEGVQWCRDDGTPPDLQAMRDIWGRDRRAWAAAAALERT